MAAVVLPLSLLPSGGDGRGLDPQPAETITPTTEAGAARPALGPGGRPARVPYVAIEAQRLVTPAGTYDLPEAYPQIVPYGDGWVAVSSAGTATRHTASRCSTRRFARCDGAGESSDLAVREDGSEVAWVEFDGVDQWTLRGAPRHRGLRIPSSTPVARGGPGFLGSP